MHLIRFCSFKQQQKRQFELCTRFMASQYNDQAVRMEKDALGVVAVPASRLWGAQTQRSIENFKISENERMPTDFIRAVSLVKLAAASVNIVHRKLSPEIGNAVKAAANEVLSGQHDAEFPLVVWQTGSGTQTNMNVNEVIANRAIQLLGGNIGTKTPVHPNDHVNLGQSSNDVFPTAMHISTALGCQKRLIPALKELSDAFAECERKFGSIIKIGRTHLQDATPLSLGQEFSAFRSMVENGIRRIESSLKCVFELAQGGTAVGTGLNTYEGFAESFAAEIAKLTGEPFVTSRNKFESLGSVNGLVEVSSMIATTASDLFKIANDIRLLGSGPRSGFCELILPSNEPGSSIMPGKSNPTQCEALSMVCAEIIGNNTTVQISSTHGHLQLNVFRPVIIFNILRSIRLLSDACLSFSNNCVKGIIPNEHSIKQHLNNSLMLVTVLSPVIGYDNCATIAMHAHKNNMSLKEATLALQIIDEKTFDSLVKPETMITPSSE